jgi:hypothetical protein
LVPLIVVAVLLLFALIRVRLRAIPLERDEGEYAYAGQLILQRIPPYKLAYNMKLPGTYAAYAVILFLLGQTPSGIHVGLLLVNAATTVMMFFLGKRLSGELGGVACAAAYALLSTGVAIMGLQAHATHFVVLAAVAGLLVFVRSISSGRPLAIFCAGLLFGAAVVMKQPGLFFAIFATLQLAYSEWRRKQPWRSTLHRVGIFLVGVVLPFALTCAVMKICGVFDKFWFWVFDYARAYGSIISLGDGLAALETTAPDVAGPAIGVWLLAGAGALAFAWDRDIRKHAVFCLGLLVFSFLAVCPGLYFRPHYFILMLPAVALLDAVAVHSFTRLVMAHWPAAAFLPAVVFFGAFGLALFDQSDALFQMDPVSVCRLLYKTEPFPEAQEVGDYIKSNSASTDRIAVMGSDPEIYFYSHRHSATGYIYIFPLSEDQPYAAQMQREMISEIEAAHPLFLVMHPASWFMAGTHGAEERHSWAERYLKRYDMVALVDLVAPDRSEFYRWEVDGRDFRPRNPLLYVFRRKGG